MTATLDISDLVVEYRYRAGLLRPSGSVRAVDRVSLRVEAGTTLGLVGESGSGKTSVARAIVGIVPITEGRVVLAGRDVRSLSRNDRRSLGRSVQMVFQQPTTSLDPRRTAGASIGEPLVHLLGLSGRALNARVAELLEMVGLERAHASRLPRHLSGGQRQRVAIARAIATSPALIICDEPTSSLDVSVQAQIINLLVRLQADLGLSYLFISHDLGTVRQIADTIAVMHRGRIVEQGAVDAVLSSPADEYTRTLISAVPTIDRVRGRPAPAQPGAAQA